MKKWLRSVLSIPSRWFRYRPQQIDAIHRHRWSCLLGGAALVALGFILPASMKYGALVGLMLLHLGVYSFILRKWRTERFGPQRRPAAPADPLRQVEIAIAAWLFLMQVRLAFSIMVENWTRTRRSAPQATSY